MRLASRLFRRIKIDNFVCRAALLTLSLFLASCGNRSNAVSGTIEVDEVHVGPRSGGRVEKIFAWEGDKLRSGQPIVELDASELRARREDVVGIELRLLASGAHHLPPGAVPQDVDMGAGNRHHHPF